MAAPAHVTAAPSAAPARAVAPALAGELLALDCLALPAPVVAKVKACLFDMLGCAMLARTLPWGRQAAEFAAAVPGNSTILGSARRAALPQAAFANATMAHGLVQEDIHPPSSAHLGVVVLPALLALAEHDHVAGADFVAAVVAGYEAMGRLGRVLIDKEVARRFRPTGLIGPFGAAAGCARLLRLTQAQAVAAMGLAANRAGGLNEWAFAGGTEVFFHAGFAASDAITAAMLARLGVFASPTALDGPAGLLAAFDRRHRAEALARPGDDFEIMTVRHKPVPACNYVQGSCQAALRLVREHGVTPEAVRQVAVRVFDEAIAYPGCDYAGPFDNVLQAKMSIQYAVASVLVRGTITDENFRGVTDPAIARIAAVTALAADPGFQQAFPARQGAEVCVTLTDGRTATVRQDDMASPPAEALRARFLAAAGPVLGGPRAAEAAALIDALERLDDMASLVALLVPGETR